MFGLGMGEIVIIAIVALLFLGPDKLPSAAKTIGKTIRSFRSQTRELTDSLERDTELGDAVRELRSALHDVPQRVVHHQPPSTAADDDGDDSEHHGDEHIGAGSRHGDEHIGVGSDHGDYHHHLEGDGQHTEAGAQEDESDESVELAEPIGGEPDVPTVRPAQGSVARLYSESDGDAPTEPPRQPKPAGEGNG